MDPIREKGYHGHMPFLPLDQPDPLMATMAIMHYPGQDDLERARARALASRLLAEPLKAFHADGQRLGYDQLAEIATGAGESIDDLEDRHFGGTAIGEVFKVLFALHNTEPVLASWENAIKITRAHARRHEVAASRSLILKHRQRFHSVAHLWAALSLRENRWTTDESCGYEGAHDFAYFLEEAETLRRWGQHWRHPREGSEPPLPKDVWRVPQDWSPPERQPGWPTRPGRIPMVFIDEDVLRDAKIRRPGRPKNSS
ncbi:MAG: hypothetical protein NXI30_02750 [bacterium]|nr:hypothetical protein [bacterium]